MLNFNQLFDTNKDFKNNILNANSNYKELLNLLIVWVVKKEDGVNLLNNLKSAIKT